MTETLAHGYSFWRVLSESYPMNTNITGFKCFFFRIRPCALYENSLSVGRVNDHCTGSDLLIESLELVLILRFMASRFSRIVSH